MERRKSYKRPFWSMIVLIILRLVYAAYIAIVLMQLNVEGSSVGTFLFLAGIYLVVLIAETAAYWYIRKWTYRRFLAWWHIGLLYVALVLLPVLYGIVRIADLWFPPDEYLKILKLASTLRYFLFWGSIGLGHFFFAMVIVEGVRNRKNDKATEGMQLFDSV